MNIVFFTGAGMSAESGLSTFRDSGGLWESYRIEDVATPDAWRVNPALVLEFYNKRFQQLLTCEPNAGHFAIATLQSQHNVQVITQNVDDLHERAGTQQVVHLHGELIYARSVANPSVRVLRKGPISLGDCANDGCQLRPDVVWFGEEVPKMEEALDCVRKADVLVVVGTSLQVYPAAGLVYEAQNAHRIVLIDPNAHGFGALPSGVEVIPESATKGLQLFVSHL